MAELRIYHGKPDGLEPPKEVLKRAINAASESSNSVEFSAGEIAHHSRVQHHRSDFGSDTEGETAICLCDPENGTDIPTSDLSGDPIGIGSETIHNIQQSLRDELGAGFVDVVRLDESYRIDEEGTPRALPKALDS